MDSFVAKNLKLAPMRLRGNDEKAKAVSVSCVAGVAHQLPFALGMLKSGAESEL
jgi:hypothetical protein